MKSSLPIIRELASSSPGGSHGHSRSPIAPDPAAAPGVARSATALPPPLCRPPRRRRPSATAPRRRRPRSCQGSQVLRQAAGPAPKAILGWRGNVVCYFRDPVPYLEDLRARFGNVAALVSGGNDTVIYRPVPGKARQTVFGFGAEINREVITQVEVFGGGDFRAPDDAPWINGSMSSAIGQRRVEQKSVLSPAFVRDHLKNYYNDMAEEIDRMLAGWARPRAGRPDRRVLHPGRPHRQPLLLRPGRPADRRQPRRDHPRLRLGAAQPALGAEAQDPRHALLQAGAPGAAAAPDARARSWPARRPRTIRAPTCSR